jgi:hypothetical protein
MITKLASDIANPKAGICFVKIKHTIRIFIIIILVFIHSISLYFLIFVN